MNLDWLRCAPRARRKVASRRSRSPTSSPSSSGPSCSWSSRRRSRDLTTATLSLMAVAIAINIAVGSITVALRLPIYLDSIGTVLVGALAGPWAGALTGLLSNLIWSILPMPGGAGPTAAFFAPVAAVIGLMAGFWASRGVFRLRPDDARVGGFLAVATGIAAAAHRDPHRPGDDRTPELCPEDPARSTTRCGSSSSRSRSSPSASSWRWVTGRTVFALAGRRPADRAPYLRSRRPSRPLALVFAILRLLFAPDRLLLDGGRRPR